MICRDLSGVSLNTPISYNAALGSVTAAFGSPFAVPWSIATSKTCLSKMADPTFKFNRIQASFMLWDKKKNESKENIQYTYMIHIL